MKKNGIGRIKPVLRNTITSLSLVLISLSGLAKATVSTVIDSNNREARRQYDHQFYRALMLATQGRQLSVEAGYAKGLIESTCIISLVQANTNGCKEAIRSLHTIMPLALKAGDSVQRMKVYSALGVCWFYSGNYDSARFYHEKAIRTGASERQSGEHADEYLLLAKVYIKNGGTEKAMEYYRKALPVFEKGRDQAGVAWCQELLGEVFYAQRLYEKALTVLNQSYGAFMELDIRRGQAAALLHKGNAFYMLIKDDSAKACYSGALAAFTALGDSHGMATCYSNLSRILLEADKTDQAIEFANKALDAIKPGNYISIEAGTYQHLGDIYGELRQYNKAVAYVQKAMAAARAGDNKVIVMDCLKSLSELYQAMKKHELAFDNLLAAYRLKDSIQPLAFSKQLGEMQAKYETEKKETEIKLLRQQGQIDVLKMQTQASRLKRQGYLLVMLVIMIGVLVVATYYYIARRKLLEQIRKDRTIRETEENERVRIAKDIHDELGSGLSKIKFLSELATSQLEGKQQLQASLYSISDTSVHLVENMRDLIWAMNPENTTLDNLIARIREYAVDYLEEFPIEVVFDIPEHIPSQRISKEMNRNVLMIVKEALQNIVKHADAKNVFIKMSLKQKFSLEIGDDGTGYDEQAGTDGNGIKNMRARGLVLGTTLKLESLAGKGSKVRLEFDLECTS